jgi:valyl-tRNA synthetase
LKTARAVTAALEACAFDDAASALYRFIWNVFCDWSLEFAKPVLAGDDEGAKAETRAMTAWVLDVTLKLLHPVMPFMTEELWDQTGVPDVLISQPWPELPDNYADEVATAEMRLAIAVIAEGRSVRSELNVPAAARPPLLVTQADASQKAALEAHWPAISQMLRVGELRFTSEPGPGTAPYAAEGAAFALPVAEFIDLAAERARLAKELAARAADIERAERKLANADFVAKAPAEVIEESRERLEEARSARARLESAKARLEALA